MRRISSEHTATRLPQTEEADYRDETEDDNEESIPPDFPKQQGYKVSITPDAPELRAQMIDAPAPQHHHGQG